MRVLFIKLPEPAAPVMRRTYVPPIGLWAMRETIRATHQDWTVHVVDMHLGAELPPGDYDLVGISAQFSTQHALYEELAATARRRWPRATVIAGGFHASAVKAPPGVDQVIHGSGEAYFAGGDRRRWREMRRAGLGVAAAFSERRVVAIVEDALHWAAGGAWRPS